MLKDLLELTRENPKEAKSSGIDAELDLRAGSLPKAPLSGLNPSVQTALFEVEIEAAPGSMPRSAIEKITEEILPALGAARGCVFLRPSPESPLEPKLYFGDYEPIFRGSGPRADTIERILAPLALSNKNALEGTHYDNEAGSVQYALCRIGGSPAIGVIYIEMADEFDPRAMTELLAGVQGVSGSLANFLER